MTARFTTHPLSARGGVWRYSMGKNMWKFDLNAITVSGQDDYGILIR